MFAKTPLDWLYSSSTEPCPVCGRTKDGDCSWGKNPSADRIDIVICHTAYNPNSSIPQPGETVGEFKKTNSTGKSGYCEGVIYARFDQWEKSAKPSGSGRNKPIYFYYPDAEGNPAARVGKSFKDGKKLIWQEYWLPTKEFACKDLFRGIKGGCGWVSISKAKVEQGKASSADKALYDELVGGYDGLQKKIRLYRIDEARSLSEATGYPVFVVEGEAATDRLISLGLPATTCFGGAGKWTHYGGERFVGYQDQLEGLEFILCPDRDKPGIDHAETILYFCRQDWGLQQQELNPDQEIDFDQFPAPKWLYAKPDDPAWTLPEMGSGYDIVNWIEEMEAQKLSPEKIREAILGAIEPKRELGFEFLLPEPPKALKKTSSKTTANKADQGSQAKGEEESLCSLAAALKRVRSLTGDRLRMNLLTKDIELEEKAVTLERLEVQLAEAYNFQCRKFEVVARYVAEENGYSPVQEYLEAVYAKYGDDQSILTGFANRYFGTTEPIYEAFLRRWLISAVARAMQPGCKVDTSLILQGKQGCGKSSFFRILASSKWFDDSMGNASDKDERLKLHRCWMAEWAELEGIFRRKDVANTKAFLTCPIDHIRPPYGRSIEAMPRASVIVGTTNSDDFLSDPTGNRRFWIVPVQVRRINLSQLREERDRIWAAAMALYKKGEEWTLSDLEEEAAEHIAQQFQTVDPWQDAIERWLDENCKTITTTNELLSSCLGVELGLQDKAKNMRAADCLRRLGWMPPKNARVYQGRRQRVWTAPEPTQPTQPKKEVVSEVVSDETLANKDLQPQLHNLHNLDHQKTNFPTDSLLPSDEDWEGTSEDEDEDDDLDLLPSEVVQVVSIARNSHSVGALSSTTPHTTPHTTPQSEVVSLPKKGDRVKHPKYPNLVLEVWDIRDSARTPSARYRKPDGGLTEWLTLQSAEVLENA